MKSTQLNPAGQVRRSQLLMGAGPGAIVDLVEDAVIISGLDAWRYANETDGFFEEPRLQAVVLTHLLKTDGWKHPTVRLREPPECGDQEASPRVGIPVIRFPKWFLCQNGECRSLVEARSPNLQTGFHLCRMNPPKGAGKAPVVPVRFVSACPQGHLQDIDWRWFVHRGERLEDKSFCVRTPGKGKPNDPLGEDWNTDLYLLQTRTSGDLTDYVVGCRKCGAQRGLQDLSKPGGVGGCAGHRLHLGQDARESCTGDKSERQGARLLTRTASNAYFPIILSALDIPDPAEDLKKAVGNAWPFIKVARAETLSTFLEIPEAAALLKGYSPAQILVEIEHRRKGTVAATGGALREPEDTALLNAPPEKQGELPKPGERWHPRKIHVPNLPSFIEEVVLVKHLTEVRAQFAFSRIDAHVSDAEGEYKIKPSAAALARFADWVPAIRIPGEGFFIRLNYKQVDEWAKKEAVIQRGAQFEAAAKAHALRQGRLPDAPVDVRLIMLHTLSHLLIQSISLECGYPASAIRERLYCHTEIGPMGRPITQRMGILLYTGTPGSEGTLGGLVEVGRNLTHHLKKAVELGMLCSNDPVCAQHRPDDGQEGRHQEGAACHGCVLIGEPSCERRNMDLDRCLVVPTVEEKEAAFLADWLTDWIQ